MNAGLVDQATACAKPIQFPASSAFVQYILENHAKCGQWPIHGEEQDKQFVISPDFSLN